MSEINRLRMLQIITYIFIMSWVRLPPIRFLCICPRWILSSERPRYISQFSLGLCTMRSSLAE